MKEKFPQIGDTYYYICSVGKIRNNQYTNSEVDNVRIKLGNVFKTEEQAEFALEKTKVIVELEQMGYISYHNINEWEDVKEKIGEKRFNKYYLGENKNE